MKTIAFILFLSLFIMEVCFCFQKAHLPRGFKTTAKFLFGDPSPRNSNNAPAQKDGGLFGGMGNIMDNLKKGQEIAKQAQSISKELAETMVAGQDPSGLVTATFNGVGQPVAIKISEQLLSQGAEAVSSAATQAMIDGHTRSQQILATKMQSLYGGVPKA